jgi:hypothetical protein
MHDMLMLAFGPLEDCLCVWIRQDVIVAVDDEPTKGVDFHKVDMCL